MALNSTESSEPFRLSWQGSLLDALLANISDAVVVCDAAGLLILANAAAKDLGLDRLFQPDSLGVQDSDGFYDSDQIPIPREDWPLVRAFRDGDQVEGQAVLLYKSREDVRELRISASPVRGGEGQILGALAVVQDITEYQQAYQTMMQNEKLVLTGQLAAVLTHEINNPLQASIGCLGLAEEVLAENGDVSRYLQVAAEELRRAAQILNQLRDLNQAASPSVLEEVDLYQLIDQILTLNRSRIEAQNIHVKLLTEIESAVILATPDRIRQVFLNLILNSLDAMTGGGDLNIEIKTSHTPQGYLVLIGDTGEGIRPEQQAHIFEPFFSTKSGGLGLGLFVTRTIIEEHGGSIRVQSRPGKGTTFSILLPSMKMAE